MEEFSLLYPENRKVKYSRLSSEAVNDLSIDYICDALTNDSFEKNSIKNILTEITCDEETIKYRRDIFDDFLNYKELRDNLTNMLSMLSELRDLERFQKDTDASSLWQLINRLREIDGYIDCISKMKECLNSIPIHSKGLLNLKKVVEEIHESGGFDLLKEDINTTFEKARSLRSITIGVNLDDMLRPYSAGVLALNDKEFSSAGLLKKFMSFAANQDELNHGTDFTSLRSFHSVQSSASELVFGSFQAGPNKDAHIETTATGSDKLSDSLKRVVTDILKKIVKDIKSVLQKYINVSGYSLVKLMPEIIFYIRFAELIEKIRDKGLPICKPEIISSSERKLTAFGIHNLKLAIKAVKGEDIDIITNEINFDDKAGIYILTGPNRGGKTTYTQAVGLLYLLAQNGIYAPAKSVILSPCDNIFTHFPADENETVDLGRLGEESQRLSNIFAVATNKSLILLNESLATTNVAEGVYIARDVLKSMRYLGCRAIFNTHMHELASNLDELNSSVEGNSIIESMITGVDKGQRSFKVTIAPPQGVSYAKDIAEKYGVTYEQIKKSIDDKKN